MKDPIAETIRTQAYLAAVEDLPAYVARRWDSLPHATRVNLAVLWVQFQEMTAEQQFAIFVTLYTRATVLAIDRVNAIADSQAATTPPAATTAA